MMRYLTLNSSGIWRFRFQIPACSRHLFDDRSVVKRSLGKISPELAQLKALELEIQVRRVLNGQSDHIELDSNRFIELEINGLITSGKRAINEGLSLIRRSPKLTVQLRSLTQPENIKLTEREQVVYKWDKFPDLGWLREIYMGSDSPAEKADKWLGKFDNRVRSSLVLRLNNYYELMRDAQAALIRLDFKTVSSLIEQLDLLPDSSSYLRPDVVGEKAHSNSSSARSLIKQRTPRNVYSLEAALKAFHDDKRILRAVNSSSMSSVKIESELRREANRCRVVHQLVGIDDISRVKRQDVIRAIELLSEFPVVSKQSKYRDKFERTPISKWIELGKELGFKPLSHKTIFSYVSAASALYEWANRHIDSLIGNPWRGVIKKRKSGHNQLHERRPFSQEELSKIFSQRQFVEGEKGLYRRNRRRLYYQYWLPLIALFSGMRANEIAQLYRDDIKCKDGIHYFDLTSRREDQSLKNSGATRIIPVHSKLIELGFIDFLNRFTSEQHLFPELTYSERDGYFKSAGEWFRRFLREVLDDNTKLSFYSFRHTFADAFKQQQVVSTIPGTLLGHKSNTITFDVYGGSVMLETLQNNIEMLNFSSVVSDVKPFGKYRI